MGRVLSKTMLIAVALLILFSVGCAKAAIPSTISEVVQAMHSFHQSEITYDELKNKIVCYYIDFNQTIGEEIFIPGFGEEDTPVLYKDLEGLTVEEIKNLSDLANEGSAKLDIEPSLVSSKVSVSKPMETFLDQQMVFTWREDIIQGMFPDDTCMILSTCYYLSKVDGEWKIDRSESMRMLYQVSDTDEEKQKQIDLATLPYQDEAEYVQTIVFK